MKSPFFFFVLLVFFSCQETIEPEKILFSSNRNGNNDIFLMNADGTNTQVIVNSSSEEWGGVFVDSNTISFLRQVNDSVKRFEFNLNTKKEVAIPHPGTCYLDDKNAVYSSHGDYVFSCGLGLYLKEKNHSKFKALPLGNRNTPNYLSWSFDGKWVLYTDDLTGSNDVYSVNIDTHEIRNLTQSDSNDERGDLSPDGTQLVFSSNRHNPRDRDLFILNLETREIENITNSSGYDLIGRWSLDGKSILYGSNKDGNWELYRYILADKSTQRLTENAAFDGDPRVR